MANEMYSFLVRLDEESLQVFIQMRDVRERIRKKKALAVKFEEGEQRDAAYALCDRERAVC